MATAFLLIHLHDKFLVVWNGKFRQTEHRLLRFLASHTHHIVVGTDRKKPIDDLAVDVEIPLVVRVFNTDGATHTVDINAFIEPDSSEELKNCIYADAITATFVYDDSIPK